MTSCAVLIPVLDRPHRVKPLLASLEAAHHPAHTVRAIFVCSPYDDAEIAAVREAGGTEMIVDWQPGKGDYARKINAAFRATDDEWAFLAADDIQLHPGWFQEALIVHDRYHPCVIGTNDMGNPRVTSGMHSVYTLVHRNYGECGVIDDPDCLLYEGYWHNFVDDEFVQTAISRQTYMHAGLSHVEHLHPHWKKAPQDDTYALGQVHFDEDRAHHFSRRHLWASSVQARRRAGSR